jgi:hypothetical protein
MALTATSFIIAGSILTIVVGPIVLAVLGWWRAPARARAATAGDVPWHWRLTVLSTVLYVLAFNLTFLVQELGLVLPKAMTPGLQPTLFHNNHLWVGEHPLAALFQGTGAMATFAIGIVCALVVRRSWPRSTGVRCFLVWMAYCGIFMALPQVVVGALVPENDVGMAMGFFGLSAAEKAIAALLALAAMPVFALWLLPSVLALAPGRRAIADAGTRVRFIFGIATLPAFVAIVPIVAFRVPREWIEVLLLPVIVAVVGIPWMQAAAAAMRDAIEPSPPKPPSLALPTLLALALLVFFQLVLRHGIPFF